MEKRNENRVIKRLEVKFQTSMVNTAITSDLSESGLFIRTTRGINPGNIISVKLNLPNTQELVLTGRVVRSMRSTPGFIGESKSGMGIQLINPPQNYIDYIQSIRN